MSPLRLPALALAAALPLAGCSWFADAPEPKPNPNEPRLVGRIASIPPDRKFVLIESYGKWSVPVGAILTVHGPDKRSANLVATGEVLRRHAAADIQSGTLEVGDGVYTTAPLPPEASATGSGSTPQPGATPAASDKKIPPKVGGSE